MLLKSSNTTRVEVTLVGAIVCLLLIVVTQITFFWQKYQNSFYPGVFINGVEVAGHTRKEVENFFEEKASEESLQTIKIQLASAEIASSAAQLGVTKDYTAAIDEAYSFGRNESLFPKIWQIISLSPTRKDVTAGVSVDEEKVGEMIDELKKQADLPGEEPAATLSVSQRANTVKINPGKSGQAIDREKTKNALVEAVLQNKLQVAAIVTTDVVPLDEAQTAAAQQRAIKYVGKQLVLRADDISEKLNDQDLIALLAFPDGVSTKKMTTLMSRLRQRFNRAPQNAVLDIDQQTLKVKKFLPPKIGLTVSEDETKALLQKNLPTLADGTLKSLDLKLPVVQKEPSTALATTNTLGIAERIGLGESQYFHSIPTRIHNVALTAERVNNTLVKPGEEFSFNKTLGDVSKATGYQPAYVIQSGHTVLGDGGGVCQVSTTLFRALLNGGLPITKRHAHSYRVSYYELNSKPGVDATVYAGDVDLRFINDTGHYILIHTENDRPNLYLKIELYGTSDGRSAEIVDHKVWDLRPAPPTVYQDDPALPRGVVKQVDFSAGGAKASFKNVVKDKSGNIIREDVYFSNYQPWRAVFLRGTG